MSKTSPAAPKLHLTSKNLGIGISEKNREAIAHGLSRLLADTYTLYLTTLMGPKITIPMGADAGVI